MKTEYLQVHIDVPTSLVDATVAFLAHVGYDAFEETEAGLHAYIERQAFEVATLEATLQVLGLSAYRTRPLPVKNWNEAWEANYPSVFIDQFCQVIPTFRAPEPGFAHTLRIDPKMSFGTGNHETTRSMIRLMRGLAFEGQSVLDMGCGTGILGILAEQLGATRVLGIDIDGWSIENARENVLINHCSRMKIAQGDVNAIPAETYGCILANINRNVLRADLPSYARHLRPAGSLLLSGFYVQDEAAMVSLAQAQGLSLRQREEEQQWVALRFDNDLA